MNKCNVCKKPSEKRCVKCSQTYYCSKECQKKDWKEHKKSCGKSNASSDNDMGDLLTSMMSLMNDDIAVDNWHVPDFGQEYAAKYPQEKQQTGVLSSAKPALKSMQLVETLIDNVMANQLDLNHIMQRWGESSNALSGFLSSPSRRIGDIFTEKVKDPYVGDSGIGALSFSNMPKKKSSLKLSQGKVHVAVGFVDLDLLLQAIIEQNEDSVNQPAKFIGYEGSAYAVAKTNVILEMMTKKAPIRSIIEVWFSSVWTKETLNHFKNAVNNVLQFKNAPNDRPPNPTKKELHPKVRSLINHWSQSVRSPKSRQNAYSLWTNPFNSQDSIFSIVANLVESRDRVQASRHILTGEFPLMDDQQSKNLIASITMFNCNEGISPHSTCEFMFSMMPMDAILPKYQRRDTAFLDAIYKFLEDSITNICTWLSPSNKMLEVYLHFQSVTMDNFPLLASIHQLNPWTMSWSNICDYFYARKFHEMLKACSGNDTVHFMMSMNWAREVYGAHIMEYDSKDRRKILINGQKSILEHGKLIDPSGYFRYTHVITHPYNVGDMFVSNNVKDHWKDYFFKRQDSNVDVSFVPFSHTHQVHTLLNIGFTYNKKIDMRRLQ